MGLRLSSPTGKTRALLGLARKGLVRSRELQEAGIPRAYLQRLCARGVLEQVDRGLYRLATAPVKNWELKEWRGRPPLRMRVHTVEDCVKRFLNWTRSVPEATPERTVTLTSREASALLEGVQALKNQAAGKMQWPPPGLKREQSFAGVLQRLSTS